MVEFFDRHRGILGPGVPLPVAVAAVADRFEGRRGDTLDVLRAIEEVVPDGVVSVVGPELGDPDSFGMIILRIPAAGYPAHSWRVLKYRPVGGGA